MNTIAPAAVQPAVTVEYIDDPASVGAGLELIDQEAVKLQSQPLQARRATVRLGAAVAVFHVSTNLRLRTLTRINTGAVACVAFGPHARGTINGLPVRPGMVLAVAPETFVRLVVDDGWESVTFLVPPQEISAALAIRQPDREFQVPKDATLLQVGETQGRQLFDWGKRLVDAAVVDPGLFDGSEAVRLAARAELIETLVSVLGAASDCQPDRPDRSHQARSRIVKVVEEYVLAQAGATICVADLCRVAGVSERTLEYAFRAVMDLTPVAYLIRLRLHRVRQALLAAPPGAGTVSAEALKWGFWHFGDFSRAYKECFGELPSETLRRPADRIP